ncbi:MAG: DNA-processing protein DprA [Clostridia bacterium]|nr:DNA-processing protein DprA [Clostridia bacterium]
MLEQEAMAVLVSAQGVGYAGRERVLRAAGSALAVLEEPEAYADLLGAKGVSAVRMALEKGAQMLDQIARDNVHLIMRGMPEYPRLLEYTARPPHLLFCLGQANLVDSFPMAIVGTRKASRYGAEQTRKIARELAQEGVCIVSGLALGVDACAHAGALDARGRTIAVLGGALDRFYPMENWNLMRQIVDNGGSIVSEYAPGVGPNRYSFLERNRIIAGMSLGTLVTEGPLRSGAMQTASCALEEGREVFAIPGDIDRENAAMPNLLIAEGAHLVTCAQDILRQLVVEPDAAAMRAAAVQAAGKKKRRTERRAKPETEHAAVQKAAAPDLQERDGLEHAICSVLKEGEADFDALSERIGAGSDELGAALMMLELDGVIEALPGCRYRLA